MFTCVTKSMFNIPVEPQKKGTKYTKSRKMDLENISFFFFLL